MKKLIIFLGVFLFGFFDDKLYDLMYKSFLYNHDLKNAYEVATKALKYEKNSIKWHKRVAEVSLWLGKYEVSSKNYLYVYERTKSSRIEKILFEIPYTNKKIVKLKIDKFLKEFKRGNFSNSLKLAKIYYSLGDVDKAETVLEKAYLKTKERKFINAYVKYAIMSEDIQKIKKHLTLLESESLKIKMEIAYMLININDFKDAYKLLVKVRTLPKDKKYYNLLVYVMSKLGDFKKLVTLLNYMYENNLMNRSSFSLMLSYYYSIHDNRKLEEIIKYGIKKYHLNLYKDYIYILVSNGKYQEALNLLEKNRTYFSDKDYFKLKADLYYKLKNYNLASKFYEKLLYFKLSENDVNQILWFCIESNNYTLFSKIKSKISNHYLLAVAYLTFFKVDKAYEEMLKVELDSLDKYLTFINILDIKGIDSYGYKLKAFKLANKMLANDRELLSDKDFLKNYLNLAFYFMLPERIDTLFKIAEQVLSRQDYFNLKISYYFKLNEYDKLYYIKNYHRIFE